MIEMRRQFVKDPEKYKVDVPEGESGDWSVRKFEVSQEDVDRQMMQALRTGRLTPEGKYTGLYRKGQVIMSDVPDEIGDLKPLFDRAQGNVIIFGLGLGVAVQGAMMNENIDHVVVVEKSQDVISLVGDHWQEKYASKLAIVKGDAWDADFVHRYDLKFDYGWFDIWDDLVTDNLDEFQQLREVYAEHLGSMGFWGEPFLRVMRRRRY
jgi:hypothetical protein